MYNALSPNVEVAWCGTMGEVGEGGLLVGVSLGAGRRELHLFGLELWRHLFVEHL